MNDLLAFEQHIPAESIMHTPWPMLGLVHDLLLENQALRSRNEFLESKLNQNSTNSDKPPSTDSPFKNKPEKDSKPKRNKPRKGHRQPCLRPNEIVELYPNLCTCGCSSLLDVEPYYIHQYIEIPEPHLDVEHIILYRGHCSQCGSVVKALVPPERRTGFGPRLLSMATSLEPPMATLMEPVESVQNLRRTPRFS